MIFEKEGGRVVQQSFTHLSINLRNPKRYMERGEQYLAATLLSISSHIKRSMPAKRRIAYVRKLTSNFIVTYPPIICSQKTTSILHMLLGSTMV